MGLKPLSIAPFYAGWRLTNERLASVVGALSPEQLALKPAPDLWPIWANVAHLAGARVYWLCEFLEEPGADTAPYYSPTGLYWEDDPSHPRQASELVSALGSSWSVVERCLEFWTADMLQEEFRREVEGRTYGHTRQAVLMRLITHDATHCGEISVTLGMNGLRELDLWTGRGRLLPAPS